MTFRPRFCRPSLFRLLPAFLTLLLLAATARAQGHETWSYNLGVYEVNVRQYTRAGTFAAFGTHLDRLQEMGVGIVWLMPIQPVGVKNRLGSLGSPYAVRDYRAVNPAYGSLGDFKALVQQIHARGMYVIIDWVANHTAWDNVLTTTHPEWYSKDAEGRFIPPPGTNWSDVIELDYSQPGLRDYMIDALKFWVEETGIDGFRFDAVSFVPTDFWQRATAELKAFKPDIFLLAEGEGPQWHAAGFDATYGWGLYGFESGLLIDLVQARRVPSAIAGFAASERARYPADAYRMYFTSNHDENAWHGTPTELFGAAADAFAVLTATFNGLPLIYGGQEAGLDKRLRFFDKDEIVWRSDPHAAFYSRLLHLKKQHPALWNGALGAPLTRVFTTDDNHVFAFLRQQEQDRVFVALNLSSQPATVTLKGTLFTGDYWSLFADAPLALDSAAVLTLPAWGYVVGFDSSRVNTGVRNPGSGGADERLQSAPNPARATTTVQYALVEGGPVRLAVFDTLGRQVKVLVSEGQAAGPHEVLFDTSGLPGGLYYYRLQTARHTQTHPLVVVR